MLVLTRKVNERIVINGNVIITVTGITGGRVAIGIEAPREISVKREELYIREGHPNPPRMPVKTTRSA